MTSLLVIALSMAGIAPGTPGEPEAFVAAGAATGSAPLRLLAVDPGPPVRVWAATAGTLLRLGPPGRLEPVPLPPSSRDEDPAEDAGSGARALGLVKALPVDDDVAAGEPPPRLRALVAAQGRAAVGLPAGLALVEPAGPGRWAVRLERLDGRPVDALAVAGRQWLAAQGPWVFRSGDRGRTWARQGRAPAAVIGLAAAGPAARDVIAVHDRGVARSGDAGRTFTPVAWAQGWGRPLRVTPTARGGAGAFLVLGERALVRIVPGAAPEPVAVVDQPLGVCGAASPRGADWVLDADLRRAGGPDGRLAVVDRGLGSAAALAVAADPARDHGAYVVAGAVIYRLLPAPEPVPVTCRPPPPAPGARPPRAQAFLRRWLLPRMTVALAGVHDPSVASRPQAALGPAWLRRGAGREITVVVGLSWPLGQARSAADLLAEQAATLADTRARARRRGRGLRAACRAAAEAGASPESPAWTERETQRALPLPGPRAEEDP